MKKLILFSAALFMALGAEARPNLKKLVLDFNPNALVDGPQRPGRGGDGMRRPRQNVLKLKQAINEQYPNLNPRELKLRKVELVAKSRHGMGTAALRIGQWTGEPVTIDGFPEIFRNSDLYDHLELRNQSRAHQGRWQIVLRGRIKVFRVIAYVKKPRVPQPPPTPVYDCGFSRQDFRNPNLCSHSRPEWLTHLPRCGETRSQNSSCAGPPGITPLSSERIYAASCKCKRIN